jgi:hypothetical protein
MVNVPQTTAVIRHFRFNEPRRWYIRRIFAFQVCKNLHEDVGKGTGEGPKVNGLRFMIKDSGED